MPFVLGGRLAEITVLEDGDSLGGLTRECLPEWFWPDIEVGTRTRRLIKTRIMICLSGAEPDAAWYCGSRTRRTAGTSASALAVQEDNKNAADLGDYTCEGSLPELEVHLE